MYELRILGGLSLTGNDGEDVLSVLSRPTRVAFLSFLRLSAPAGFISRDRLLAVFWPESDEAHGRNALSQVLHGLRKSLGDDVVLTRGQNEVGLKGEILWCDVQAFEEAAKTGDHDRALELYRGELLDGFQLPGGGIEFDQWVEGERARLKEMAAVSAWAVAHALIDGGQLTEAEQTAQRALSLVCTKESEVRRFIGALAGAGDRAAAIQFFERFCYELRVELDLEPSLETQEVVEAVKAGAGSSTPAGLATPSTSAPGPVDPVPPGEGEPIGQSGREAAAVSLLNSGPSSGAQAGIPLHDWSLWQIIAGWAFASLVAIAASGTLTDVVGLPTWVSPATGFICLGALPLVLTVTLFQRGSSVDQATARPTPAGGIRKSLTWRAAGLSVAGAFALLALGTAGYMAMRALGIGPAGTLVARGVMEDQARLLVADFSSPTSADSLTAAALSEAIRIDLAQSELVRVVNPGEVQSTLRRMELPPGSALTESVARDAAIREGIPVLLTGDLVPIGSAYQLTSRLVDPQAGTVFLTLREEARSKEELLDAVNRMIGKLRERMGENLRVVRNRPRLSYVTTASLDALRLFTQAEHAANRREWQEAVALLDEALAMDSTFAMGWRRLGIVLFNMQRDQSRRVEALTRAYALSDRLPERERIRVLASYFTNAVYDRRRAAEVYERGLARFPEEGSWWNNLGVIYAQMGEFEKAHNAYLKAVEYRGPTEIITANLLLGAMTIGDLESARRAIALRREHLLDNPRNRLWEGRLALLTGQREEARRLWLEGGGSNESSVTREYVRDLAFLDLLEGKAAAAESRFREALRLSVGSGDAIGALNDRLELMDLDALVLDDFSSARTRFEEAVGALNLDSLPPMDRPYLNLARHSASAGFAEEAAGFLEEWQAVDMPDGLRAASHGWELHDHGLVAMVEGRTEEGLDLLRQAEEAVYHHPGVVRNLALAFDRAGMADSAFVAYRRYLAAAAPNRDRQYHDGFFLPRAYERLGQLCEDRGDFEEAIRYDSLFVDLWADADPELQPRVEAARRALERLRGRTSRVN